MSCTSLSFSQTHTLLGSFGISITITVPEVYDCTNIQLRLRSETETVEDWFDYAILSQTVTTINYTFPSGVCYIDVRLIQCCPPGPGLDGPIPGDGVPFNPDDPPCALSSDSFEDECSSTVSISNPYRRPADLSVAQEYNVISIPKRVKLTVTQNNCSDINALLCTIRCSETPESQGQCPCLFSPSVDIYSLPQLNIGRLPYGVPLDIDCLCNFVGGPKARPNFSLPEYTKVEAYFSSSYGYRAVGFIDGVGYDSTRLNRNSWIKLHECDNSTQLRDWLKNHFRFFGISENKDSTRFVWPYTDLFWHPFDFCLENNQFTAESGVAYVKVVPC
jgi:hypothetical protein